ncbi:TnsA-like heteromeric transposase endonuclease subunit [Rhodococcus opacus]|uniref:TnsA-like heteromeric transposase endonuclease subunit n=1 Tax=Rhodococcus opacus TaxID=37919 RepID=UPI0029499675|nr:TnsA-like heteromeric transposase endonuclease subunit [Rhodococcus opacus]MDV6244467.1 TnsA-like heteromeric transposase endonuclease subunit [Rhodococcus opacus]
MAVDLDPHPTSVVASVRRKADGVESEADWGDVSPEELVDAATPWRTFRWYHGQKHYSGAYWSSTERALVIYESRLELARLLLADFDHSVRRILAQPFLLEADVAGARPGHVPDYLLLSDDGPVVVDVKPARRLAKPQVELTFAWTRLVVESRGWRYQIASEPAEPELNNVRFLAGYRRDWLFDDDLLTGLRSVNLHGATLGEAVRCLPEQPEPVVRSAVLHLLWRHHFTVDLSKTLTSRTMLGMRS